jgi:hypothetical protein
MSSFEASSRSSAIFCVQEEEEEEEEETRVVSAGDDTIGGSFRVRGTRSVAGASARRRRFRAFPFFFFFRRSRRPGAKKSARTHEPTGNEMLVSRTHRLGPELGVHLVHSRVEPAERTDVLLVLPRDLFGLAPLRRRESATGERVSGARSGDDLFALERRTRLKGRRARAIDRTRGPARASRGRARRERSQAGITTHAHVGFLLDQSRTHHSRAAEKCAPVRVRVRRVFP